MSSLLIRGAEVLVTMDPARRELRGASVVILYLCPNGGRLDDEIEAARARGPVSCCARLAEHG